MADITQFNEVVNSLKETTEQLQTISNTIKAGITSDPTKLPLTGGTIDGNLTADKFIGDLQGNADSATKAGQLATSCNINGIPFNGTTDINLPLSNQSWDIVIDSNDKLIQWASCTDGTLHNIYIAKGTWTYSASQDVIAFNLTKSGTKVVIGETESKIIINSTNDNTNKYGLCYTTEPASTEVLFQNITIEMNSPYQICSVFHFCKNLINCNVSAKSTGANSVICFDNCYSLVNCYGTAVSATGGYGTVAYGCKDIVNCSFTGTNTHSVIHAGTNISNTRCYVTSSELMGTCFYESKNLSNCYGESKGSHISTGRTAYKSCDNLCNCIGYASNDNGSAWAFMSCNGVINCQGRGIGTNNGYAFGSCYSMHGCRQYLSPSTTAKYDSCYASSSMNSTYACADTPNGGFNS